METIEERIVALETRLAAITEQSECERIGYHVCGPPTPLPSMSPWRAFQSAVQKLGRSQGTDK